MGGVAYVMNNKQFQPSNHQIKTTIIILSSFLAKLPNLISANISGYTVHTVAPNHKRNISNSRVIIFGMLHTP